MEVLVVQYGVMMSLECRLVKVWAPKMAGDC